MNNSVITTVISGIKSILLSRGTQLFVRVITYIAGAVGGAQLVSENDINAIAAGSVALIGFVLDLILHRIQKNESK